MPAKVQHFVVPRSTFPLGSFVFQLIGLDFMSCGDWFRMTPQIFTLSDERGTPPSLDLNTGELVPHWQRELAAADQVTTCACRTRCLTRALHCRCNCRAQCNQE